MNTKQKRNNYCGHIASLFCKIGDPSVVFSGLLVVVVAIQTIAFIESERAFVFPDHVEFADNLASPDISPTILLPSVSKIVGRVTPELSISLLR